MPEPPRRRGRPPREGLTEPQRRTLAEVRDYIATNRFSPSIQDLARRLGISPASAHEQVNQLVRKGYLSRLARTARSLSVVRGPDEGPAELVAIPVVGTVAAGYPVYSDENVIGEVMIEGSLVPSGKHFALHVVGASMKDAGILAGDVVIVRQQPVAENGDIVVALVDGEATVKRLYMSGEILELRPENPRFRPIVLTADHDVRIMGKVVATRKTSMR